MAALALPAVSSATKYVDRFVGSTAIGTQGGQFSSPRDVAVSQFAGHVGWFYVVDTSNHRIQAFNAAGVFQFAIGRDVIKVGPAVDADLGDVFEKCTNAADCKAGVVGPKAGELDDPQGVAVNQDTGDIYVRDRDNRRVQQFTADGAFVRTWGWGVDTVTAGTGFEVCSVVANCGQGSAGAGLGQFGTPAGAAGNHNGIAIQPGTGDVIVVDPASANRRLQKFEADGTVPVQIGSSANFSTNQPLYVGVDAAGIVYASDNNSSGQIDRYDLNANGGLGGFISSITAGTTGTLGDGSTLGMEVDTATGRLFVARGSNGSASPFRVVEVANPGGAPSVADTHLANASTGASGLGYNSATGDLLVATNVNGHRIFIADDDGAPPADVAVLPASGVTANAATVQAEVDSSGLFSTGYRLEISRNGIDWSTVTTGELAAGDSITASGTADALLPNTLYRVRVVTQKQFGNPEVPSAELTFLTDAQPPEVRTTSVQSVSGSTATVSARINPHSTQTSYHLEWGQGAFNKITPLPDAPVGGGARFVYVSQHLAGLQSDTTYQFRFVATSVSEGSTTGPSATFTTTQSPAGVDTPSEDRGYELVSPPDKIGGQGVGLWYSGPSSLAASGMPSHEGERFANVGERGGVLLNGAYTFGSDWAFAERADDESGWVNHSPITHPASNDQSYKYLRMSAATDNFERVSWAAGTNALLRPFPEMEGWPDAMLHARFIGDWAGRWEIFGPTAYDPALLANSGNETLLQFSDDGSTVVGGAVGVRGLAGPGDPTLDPSFAGTSLQSIYRGDVSGQVADTLAGTGDRELLNVCADGTDIPAVDGSGDIASQHCSEGDLISSQGAAFQDNFGAISGPRSSPSRAVSRNGSRVFFMSPDPGEIGLSLGGTSGAADRAPAFCVQTDDVCPPQLYASIRREDGSVATRWISRSRSQLAPGGAYGGAMIAGQDASLTGRVIFEGASEDGDKVLFRTNSPLTPDDPNGGSQVPGGVKNGAASSLSWDLYLYDLPDGPDADPGDGTLTRISAGPTGAGDGNGRQHDTAPIDGDLFAGQAIMRFASDDASRIYFVTSGSLPGVAAPTDGTIAGPGGTAQTEDQTNLYLYDANQSEVTDRWRYVTRLPRAIQGFNACASTGVVAGTPLGSSEPGDADPDKALPQFAGSGRRNCVRGNSVGTFITFWTAGRLTDDDPDAVTGDIYGYDADRDELVRLTASQGGVGGAYKCVQGSSGLTHCNGDQGMDKVETTAPAKPILGMATDPENPSDRIAFFQSQSRLVPEDTDANYDVYQWRNGKLSLISPGFSSTDGVSYRGNNASGSNVYLATRDKLTWQDVDSVADSYVARVGGGIPQPLAPVICSVLAGGCQDGGSQATAVVAPVSSAPSGGNVTPAGRMTIGVPSVSAKARRAAVRRGVLAVRVKASAASRLSVVVRGRIGKRSKVLGKGASELSGAGATTMHVRLSRESLRRLRAKGRLALQVTVLASGARARTITTVLRRAGK